MFKTLKNAWRIPELKKKLLFTLLIVVLYRLGASIPVPYVNPDATTGMAASLFGQGILQYLNALSGEALGKATLLALGVSPYITASIVMQLLTIAIPALERLSKDGEEGRKKITAITRVVTVALALITSIAYALFLRNNSLLLDISSKGIGFEIFCIAVMVACYCAGAALVMWLAEKINDHGIGNGISIILFANIVAGFKSMALNVWQLATNDRLHIAVGIVLAVVQVLLILGMIVLIVWMSDAERRIPIQYAKRVVGRKMYGGQNTNLPLKVNMSGVMPIIFANSIVAIPSTIEGFITDKNNWFCQLVSGKWGFLADIKNESLRALVQSLVGFNPNSWIYLIVFLVLLIAFAFFYVAISFNPVEVANNIKNNGGAVPGIRSGKPTVDYIKKILNRITLVGALLVAFIAVFPMVIHIVTCYFSATANLFAAFAFAGSSLMIAVGVALETTRELEAQMSLRNYKGFLD